MKIPFDIKYRPQIESGEIKVINRLNEDVRIVCWDGPDKDRPIVGFSEDDTTPYCWYLDGKYRWGNECEKDLFIIIEESVECKMEIAAILEDAIMWSPDTEDDEWEPFIKEKSTELFDITQKEMLKSLPKWKTVEEATTARTDAGDCVTTELLLVKGLAHENDYQLIESGVRVNSRMICIPISDLLKLPIDFTYKK